MRESMRIVCKSLCFFVLLMFLAACSDQDETPEAQIKATIEHMQNALKERNRRAFSEHVSDDFKGAQGTDKDALNNLVRFHILRNQNIQVYTVITSIEKITQQQYRVELTAFLGSKQLDFSQESSRLSADVKKVQAYFSRASSGSKEWYLSAADWQ